MKFYKLTAFFKPSSVRGPLYLVIFELLSIIIVGNPSILYLIHKSLFLLLSHFTSNASILSLILIEL